MDLDKLKKSWQENQSSPTISEDKIAQMLNNKGKGAFNKLLKYEKWVTYIAPILILFTWSLKNLTFSIIFLCSILIGVCWQIYKYRFLKNTDIINMSLVEITERISIYRIYVYREFIVSFVWCIIFSVSFAYFVIHNDYSYKLDRNVHSETTVLLIFGIWCLVIVPLGTWLLYRKFFIQNIKKIEKSLHEAKEYSEVN